MSLAPRHLATLVCAAAWLASATAFAPGAAADPDIDTESASAVIDELQEQGYAVEINGVPSGDTSLLTTCKVTAIHRPDGVTPDSTDPTTTTTIYVDVACPIQRG